MAGSKEPVDAAGGAQVRAAGPQLWRLRSLLLWIFIFKVQDRAVIPDLEEI